MPMAMQTDSTWFLSRCLMEAGIFGHTVALLFTTAVRRERRKRTPQKQAPRGSIASRINPSSSPPPPTMASSSSDPSSCRFAVLARILGDHHCCYDHTVAAGSQVANSASSSSDIDSSADDDAFRLMRGDLIIVLSSQYLHVFARKIKNLSCSCRQDPQDKLLASGLHCPHVIGYDDYCCVAAIPLRSIAQVLITYRTSEPPGSQASTATIQGSSGGVAARTKDLILRLNNDAHVWLEFEHNLARGVFLEALTSSVVSPIAAPDEKKKQRIVDVDVDYVDLSETSGFAAMTSMQSLAMFPALANPLEELEPGSPKKKRSPSAMIQELFLPANTEGKERDARFLFVRDALRHVAYDKVHLALQIAREQPTADDPTSGLLLSTAMEITQALDEPDLSSFTWLSSGFINMRASSKADPNNNDSNNREKLALAQVTHSIELARENGFPYLLSLALHCAADLHFRAENFITAKECLVEAARLTPDAVELAMKMQLHRKIHDLRECTKLAVLRKTAIGKVNDNASTSEAVSLSKKIPNAFSLWDHSVGAQFKHVLLHKVLKLSPPAAISTSTDTLSQQRSSSCYVEIAQKETSGGSLSASVSIKQLRLRVFFDSLETFEWLKSEVLGRIIRHRLCVDHASSAKETTIEGFWDRKDFDPNTYQQQQHISQIEWRSRLGDVVTSENQVFVAKLGELESLASCGSLGSGSGSSDSPAKVAPVSEIGKGDYRQRQQQPPPAAAIQAEPVMMVTCSACHARIPLDDVEIHSETCC